MNLLICSKNSTLALSLVHKMMPKGHNIIRLNDLDEVKAAIPKRGLVVLIDDEAFTKNDLIKTISEIKKDPEKSTSRIIIVTKSHDMALIKVFVKAGSDLVLQSSLHYETIAEKVFAFTRSLSAQHSDRKHLRIKPDAADEANLQILLEAEKRYVDGSITDVSMGGVAAKFSDEETALMMNGSLFHSCKLSLKKRNVVADLRLVKKGGNMGAFAIEKIRDSFKDVLAEYLFDKIQKNTEE